MPKYRAAINWLDGNSTKLPVTSADVPKPTLLPCNPDCVWGVCYNGIHYLLFQYKRQLVFDYFNRNLKI